MEKEGRKFSIKPIGSRQPSALRNKRSIQNEVPVTGTGTMAE